MWLKLNGLREILAILLLLLASESNAQNLQKLDQRSFRQAQSWRSPASDEIFGIYSGSVLPAATLLPAGLYAFSTFGKRKDSCLAAKAITIGTAGAAGILVSQGLKILFRRPRPFESMDGTPAQPIPDRWSMPSGHSSLAFSTATALCLEFPRWEVITPSLLWAGGVGFSRVMLGHHYPGDVLAGAFTGAACAWANHALNKKLREKWKGKK